MRLRCVQLVCLFLLISWVFALSRPAHATLFYLRENGSDTGGCGLSTGFPCATWSFLNAANTPSGGDTVCILNDTGSQELNEKFNIELANSGTSGNPLIFDFKCGGQVARGIIDGTSVPGGDFSQNALMNLNNVDWVEIHDPHIRNFPQTDVRGIQVRGGSDNIKILRPLVTGIGNFGSNSMGIGIGAQSSSLNGGSNHLIQGSVPSNPQDPDTYDCQLHGNFQNSIRFDNTNNVNNNPAGSSIMENCAMWDAQGDPNDADAVGFGQEADNWTIRDNLISNGPGGEDGLDVGHSPVSTNCLAQGKGVQNLIVERNYLIDLPTKHGPPSRSMFVLNGCVENAIIRNNVISTSARGFQMYAHPKNVQFYHNTLRTSFHAFRSWQMIDGLDVRNNIFIACVGQACDPNGSVQIDHDTRQCCQDNNHCLWQNNVIVADGAATSTIHMDILGGSFTPGGCLASEAIANTINYTESQLSIWENFGWFGATSRTDDASWGTEPLLIDINNNDFRLQSGDTIARDQGQVIASVPTDFLGNTRDGTPDIGAFEFVTAASLVGRFPEPVHNITTDPTAIIISASGCESTLEAAAPGSVYLLNAGTCTANVFNLDNITVYPNNNASVTLQGTGSTVINAGDNTTIAGMTIDAENASNCVRIEGSADNVTFRSNNIFGGDTGDCVRVTDSASNILITRNNINGGAGPLGSSGITLNCRRTSLGTGPTNVTFSENHVYKDAAQIGWTDFGGSTEDLIAYRGCGANHVITKNWFDQMPSEGEELADFKENKDVGGATFSYNFLDGRSLETVKKCMILQVEPDHVSDAFTNRIDIYGNVFYACDQGPATGALNYAADNSKPNIIQGDLTFNLFVSENSSEDILTIQELSDNANIVHNTIVKGDIRFQTGSGSEPENDFTDFTDNYIQEVQTIDNGQFNATNCDDNGVFNTIGSLDGSCINTSTLSASLPDCVATNTNLDCTPTSPSFIGTLGADGFPQGALPPPVLIISGGLEPEIGNLGDNIITLNHSVYSSALPHNPGPLRNLSNANIIVTYNDVTQAISSSQVVGNAEIRLTMANNAISTDVVEISMTTGYCTDSADLGFATDIIGHSIDAKCAAVAERIILNNISGPGVVCPAPLTPTIFVSASGSGSSCTVGSPCALQTGLDNASAGDVVQVADGTYTDRYDIDNNAGTAGNRITVQAENCHDADLRGDNNFDSNDIAFNISVGGWDVEGFDISQYFKGVFIDGPSGEPVRIKHNLISESVRQQVECRNTPATVIVERNVIAFTRNNPDDDWAGIWVDNGCSNSIMQENIIYSIHNDGLSGGFEQFGYGIYVLNNADNNEIKGNLIMDTAKAGIGLFNDPGANASGNVIRDNINAYISRSDGILLQESNCSPNTITNNISFEARNHLSTKGCTNPGANIWTHNTMIGNEFTRAGVFFTGGLGGFSNGAILKNNLIYSDEQNEDDNEFWVSFRHDLMGESDFNLFWRPGANDLDWIQDGNECFDPPCASYGSNDIHAPASQPLFVDLPNGDITLQAGSPGKGAADDATDMGATFNTFLRSDFMARVTALETVQQSTSGTSHSIGGLDPNSQYQTFIFIPVSTHSGTENFTIEGNNIQRDYNFFVNGNDFGINRIDGTNIRWLWVGTHQTDGTLNISWTLSNSVSQVFIRRMPPVEEAFTWLGGAGAPPDTEPPTQPQNLVLGPVTDTTIQVAWDASTDNVAVLRYRLERCTGASCSSFSEIQQITAPTVNYLDVGLAPSTVYRYRVRAEDTSGNFSIFSNEVEISTDAGPPVGDTEPPTDPSNLVDVTITSNQVDLMWTASTDNVAVLRYRLERCTGLSCIDFSEIDIIMHPTVTYSDTGLTSNTDYRYRIRAEDTSGNLSGYSNVLSVKTLIAVGGSASFQGGRIQGGTLR